MSCKLHLLVFILVILYFNVGLNVLFALKVNVLSCEWRLQNSGTGVQLVMNKQRSCFSYRFTSRGGSSLVIPSTGPADRALNSSHSVFAPC